LKPRDENVSVVLVAHELYVPLLTAAANVSPSPTPRPSSISFSLARPSVFSAGWFSNSTL
jgi:hypothetical protein